MGGVTAHRVVRLGHRGDGVTAEGLFAARVLPGEVVTGAVEGGRIAAPKILEPVAERVRPPCPHYARCGGCALMHAADGFVAAWKAEVVARALAAHGLTVGGLAARFRPMQVSPPASRRRAVMAGRRVKSGAVVGFHGPASETLVAIPECRLLHPDLLAARPALEALTRAGASRRGEIAFAVTRTLAGLDVAARGGRPVTGALAAELAGVAAGAGFARLSWEGELLAQAAPPVVRFGWAEVVLPPGAFLQATEAGEAALLAAVQEAVGNAPRLADLFAGCGTFALPLAEAAEVHAVEGDAAMLSALEGGWRRAPGLRRVTAEARDLFRRPLTAAELAPFAAVVIDPPRAGAAAQMAEIARAGVPVVAAVSCNPLSFARDAAVLVAAGYRLDWVQVVDQFRWSTHVELAARLSHPHMGG